MRKSHLIAFVLSSLLAVFFANPVSAGPRGITRSPNRYGPVDINRRVSAQQFDMDRDGNIYYAEILPRRAHTVGILRVSSAERNTAAVCVGYQGDTLKLPYCGHPTGMAVQNAPDGPYVWISGYANRRPNAHYWDAITVCRVKYVPGRTLLPDDPAVEHFWFPHSGHMNVALDEKNDQIAFCFYRTKAESDGIPKGRSRRVRIYRLSEVLATPLRDIRLGPWKRGGAGEPIPEYAEGEIVIRAHDLSPLTPIAEIGFHTYKAEPNPMQINATPWQGFDLNDGVVWFSEGSSRSGTFLTGYGFDDSIVYPRTPVSISFRSGDWDRFAMGSVERPALENEGVRVWNGTLCMSFFGRHPDRQLRTSVFRFAIPRLKAGKK